MNSTITDICLSQFLLFLTNTEARFPFSFNSSSGNERTFFRSLINPSWVYSSLYNTDTRHNQQGNQVTLL